MKKRFLCYTVVLFLVFSAAYLPVATILQKKNDEMKRSEIIAQDEKVVDVTKNIMGMKTDRLVSDLLYISDSLRLGQESGSTDEIKSEWVAFADRKKIYDQIRYLDNAGNEVLRVNYSSAGSYAVPQDQLQNKADRYYFADSIGLNAHQVYISKLDLNKENDQIEQPIKPMIRLAVPSFRSDGTRQGVVILNYYANDILSQVKKVSSTSIGDVSLLNSSGYWLYSEENSAREWAFMYDGRQDESFAALYPAEWNRIQESDQGSFTTDNGVFVYTRVFTESDVFSGDGGYSLVLGGGDYYVVTRIPLTSSAGAAFSRSLPDTCAYVVRQNRLAFFLLLLLAASLSVFLTMQKREREKIRYFSEYDVMTGILNRRAGFERLTQLSQELRKSGKPMSLCFIDINGLKEVNDCLGHEAGDELILTVVKVIRENIRGGDILARLGGDEFLLVFSGMNENQAEAVWQRISAGYAAVNDTENRRYLVSASHGVETVNFDGKDFIDTVVNRADEKMYEEKRRIKKDLTVIRA